MIRLVSTLQTTQLTCFMTLPSLELDGATLEQLAVLTPLELEGAPLLDDGSWFAPSTENWVDWKPEMDVFNTGIRYRINWYHTCTKTDIIWSAVDDTPGRYFIVKYFLSLSKNYLVSDFF